MILVTGNAMTTSVVGGCVIGCLAYVLCLEDGQRLAVVGMGLAPSAEAIGTHGGHARASQRVTWGDFK